MQPLRQLDKDTDDFLIFLGQGGLNGCYFIPGTHLTEWYTVGNIQAVGNGRVHEQSVCFNVNPSIIRKQTGRIDNSLVSAVNCAFGDCDIKNGWTLERIRQLQPTPSAIVETGGGWHCYWFFNCPFLIHNENERAFIAKFLKDWVKFIGSDPAACDLARCLRLPGTRNFKYFPPREVKFIKLHFDILYDLAELKALLPVELPQKEMPVNNFPASGNLEKSIENLITYALSRWAPAGRNRGGYLLAANLRSLGLTRAQVESAVLKYRSSCPAKDHPYSEYEAIENVKSAFKGKPWPPPGNTNSGDSTGHFIPPNTEKTFYVNPRGSNGH
jgi:hypothetical protein